MITFEDIRAARAHMGEASQAVKAANEEERAKMNAFRASYEKIKEENGGSRFTADQTDEVKRLSQEHTEAAEKWAVARDSEKIASTYFNALTYQYSRQQFAALLEGLADCKKLEGVPMCFKKFQRKANEIADAYGLVVWWPEDYYNYVCINIADQDRPKEENARGELYQPRISAQTWESAYYSSFCDQEGGPIGNSRALFNAEKARNFAEELRKNEFTAEELSGLAQTLDMSRAALDAEYCEAVKSIEQRAAKFDALGPRYRLRIDRNGCGVREGK